MPGKILGEHPALAVPLLPPRVREINMHRLHGAGRNQVPEKDPGIGGGQANVAEPPLGQAVGRIGCFMAGDDYGRPTSVPWAVRFP